MAKYPPCEVSVLIDAFLGGHAEFSKHDGNQSTSACSSDERKDLMRSQLSAIIAEFLSARRYVPHQCIEYV